MPFEYPASGRLVSETPLFPCGFYRSLEQLSSMGCADGCVNKKTAAGNPAAVNPNGLRLYQA